MDFTNSGTILKEFYSNKVFEGKFDEDIKYLENAFVDINRIWFNNFNQIEEVKFLMIAEAPLWGEKNKYIYNPNTNNSQFFYRSDLEDVLKKPISDKKEFIKICNEMGLLIVDISPFALNLENTAINYRKNKNNSQKLTEKEYRQLVSLTIPTYFAEKIKAVSKKKSKDIKVFFRYSRVKNSFEDLIAKELINQNIIIKDVHSIGDISKRGSGINKDELGKMILK